MSKTDPARRAHADALGLSRRALTIFLPAFAAYALLSEARGQAPTRTSAARWIDAQDEIARALSAGEIAPLAWQADLSAFYDPQGCRAHISSARERFDAELARQSTPRN